MTLGQNIEQHRIRHNIPIYYMLDVLDLESEEAYRDIICGCKHLSVYQMIMLMDLFRCPF